jgi:hypothetical protein
MLRNYENESDKPHFSNKVSVDNFNNKATATEQMPHANTDLLVDLLINPDKVISADRRWAYDGNEVFSQQHNFTSHHEDNDNHSYDNHSYDNHSYDNHSYSEKKDNQYTEKETFTEKNDSIDKEENPKSKEELLLEKLDILRKLCELKEAGVNISQNYNMNSDYNMMKYEYELHKGIRSKQNAVNWMSSMSLNCIYGLEMLNEKYNPFDLKLRGWSEQMNADINNYYDVFGDLYEKYNKPGKQMAPEIKLLLMLSGSALKFHLSNTVINSLPNLGDTINNNPELAEKLRQKAVADKLKQQADTQRNSLNNYANKEHDIATQKAADLQMLKERELEHLRMQQELAQQKQYNDLQQKLKQQPILRPPMMPNNNMQQPILRSPMMPNNMQQPILRPPMMPNMQPPIIQQVIHKPSVSPDDFETFKKQQLMNQFMQMQQIQNLENIIHTETDKSSKSNKSSKSSKSSKSIQIDDMDNNSDVSYSKNFVDIIQRSANKIANNDSQNYSYDDNSKKSADVSIGSKSSKKSSKKKSVIKIVT